MNTYDEMVRFYEQALADFEDIGPYSSSYMWGFGQSFDKASPFASEDARNSYMIHVRMCSGHHDPRGPKFSRCGNMDPEWFATDVAQGPE